MKILPIIPARGGSKGIPRKNIASLATMPLIYYSIKTAREVFGVAYVSTEDEEISILSKGLGANVIKRPSELSTDSATDYGWLKHTFDSTDADALCILRPTTPIRDSQEVLRAVLRFKINGISDSLRSVHEAPESPMKWYYEDKGKLKALNGNMKTTELPRQQLKPVYIPNGYVDITTRNTIELGSVWGEDVMSFITKPVIEIDTPQELAYLNWQLTNSLCGQV